MEYEYDTTNNDELQRPFQDEFPEIPQEEVTTKKKNVWKKSMNLVLYGFAFSLINLEYLQLNMVFPTLGNVLMLLGFRQLKNENKYFKACCVISVLRMISTVFDLTVYTVVDLEKWIPVILAGKIIFYLLAFSQTVLLISALKAVWKTTGEDADIRAAIVLAVAYFLMIPFAVLGFRLNIIVLIYMIVVIASLVMIGKSVDVIEEAGYYVEPLPVSHGEKVGAAVLVLVLVAGLASRYAFFGEYKMNWSENTQSKSAETENIKQHLIKLYFPEEILNDLTEEEIKSLDGAKRVIYRRQTGNFDQTGNSDSSPYIMEMTDKENRLDVSGIAVELPGKKKTWAVVYYFQWSSTTAFHGTEAISLSRDYIENEDAEVKDEPHGRVLYDRDGKNYVSDFHSIETNTEKEYDYLEELFGDQIETVTTDCTFSFPKDGKNCRGYIIYTQCDDFDGDVLENYLCYAHQSSRFQYPVSLADASGTCEDSLQFRTRQYGVDFDISTDD